MCASAGAGRGPGVWPRGPASCGLLGRERRGLTRALRSGLALPGPEGLGVVRGQVCPPHLVPALCNGGEGTGTGVGDWSSGSCGQAAAGEGLQVRGRDLRDPRHLRTSPTWTARGGGSSASVPGGGGVGAGAGEYAPVPAALRPSRDVSGWREPTCPLSPVQPTRSSFDSQASRNCPRYEPGFAGTYVK